MPKKKKRVKKAKKTKKINRKKFFLGLVVFLFLGVIVFLIGQIPTRNIFISGNSSLSDQEIIALAELEDYPKLLFSRSSEIRQKLINDDYILEAKVKRQRFIELHIEIKENKPLFYIDYDQKTIFIDGLEIDKFYNVPVLLNYVPQVVYEGFLDEFNKIDDNIRAKISEIRYYPTEIDEERFLFYMVDGNYVFVNLQTMLDINDYLAIMENIIANFGLKNGTLYLDAGGYFEVID